MQITTAKWRVRPPASNIIQKDASNFIVARVLFCLDSFLHNPLANFRGLCRKPSRKITAFYGDTRQLPYYGNLGEIFLLSGDFWHFCRDPPDCRFPISTHRQSEDVVLAPYIAAEKAERRRRMLEQIRTSLTEKQYRRLCLYYLEKKGEAEIAALENVNQSSVSRTIRSGTKTVERFFGEFFLETA